MTPSSVDQYTKKQSSANKELKTPISSRLVVSEDEQKFLNNFSGEKQDSMLDVGEETPEFH